MNNIKSRIDDAISEGRMAWVKDEDGKRKAAEAKREKLLIDAKAVMENLPSLCRGAAAAGRTRCKVFEERGGGYQSRYEKESWKVTFTDGVGLYLVGLCNEHKIPIDCILQDDGYGQDSWAEIWVTWE